MKNVEFDRAKRKDAPLILELMREYFEYDGVPWNKHIPTGLSSLLQDQRLGQVLLIHVNKDCAGYLVLTRGFDLEFGGIQAVVTDFYIRYPFRRLGLGKKALRHLSKICKTEGIRNLELQVEKHNKKARNFYKAMGFVQHERIPMSKWL